MGNQCSSPDDGQHGSTLQAGVDCAPTRSIETLTCVAAIHQYHGKFVRRVKILTFEDTQGILIFSEVPQPPNVSAALESSDIEAGFDEILHSDKAHGT